MDALRLPHAFYFDSVSPQRKRDVSNDTGDIASVLAFKLQWDNERYLSVC
jgi:hypothetical protein